MLSLKLKDFSLDTPFIEKLTARHLSRKKGVYYLTFANLDDYRDYIRCIRRVLHELEEAPPGRRNRCADHHSCLELLKQIHSSELTEVK